MRAATSPRTWSARARPPSPVEHQLELNQDERDLVELAKASFDTVVVVVNASTTLEMGALQDDPEIDAILLAGSPGATGLQRARQRHHR